jgi:hypothetical protein
MGTSVVFCESEGILEREKWKRNIAFETNQARRRLSETRGELSDIAPNREPKRASAM